MGERGSVPRWVAVVALAVLPVLVAGPAVAGNAAVRATASNTWDPVRTRVNHGSRVVWRNPTSIAHTVTAYGGNWSINRTLSPGEHVGRTFDSVGVFRFRCRFHSTLVAGVCSGMCGKIVVRTA